MEIQELLNSSAKIKLQVTAAQLREFGEFLIQKAAAEKQPEPEEKYFTQEEVAEILSVTRQTLWRWDTKTDYLHPVILGGGLKRYKKTDIDRIISGK